MSLRHNLSRQITKRAKAKAKARKREENKFPFTIRAHLLDIHELRVSKQNFFHLNFIFYYNKLFVSFIFQKKREKNSSRSFFFFSFLYSFCFSLAQTEKALDAVQILEHDVFVYPNCKLIFAFF